MHIADEKIRDFNLTVQMITKLVQYLIFTLMDSRL